MQKFTLILILAVLAGFGNFSYSAELNTSSPAASVGSSGAKKNQLEELFIWKVSEELKLSTIDERKFSEALRQLNSKKQSLSQKLEELTNQLINAKTDKDRNTGFQAYRKTLQEYSQLSVQELDQMHSIFGTQKFAKYIEVKIELTNKVKSLLINPDRIAKDRKPLPSPQVIEE